MGVVSSGTLWLASYPGPYTEHEKGPWQVFSYVLCQCKMKTITFLQMMYSISRGRYIVVGDG